MAAQQHLQIINPEHSQECHSFPLFPQLPTELRLQIWQVSLQRQRLITIELPTSQEEYTAETKNHLGRFVRDAHCCPTVVGSKLLSKFLRVNREARDATLRFYRVHVPCRFELGDGKEDGTLFLNPELDILYIKLGRNARGFVDLVYNLRAYDPLDVGLLNLALEKNVVGNLSKINIFESETHVQKAFRDTVTNLRQVYLLVLENAGRMYLGPLNGISTQIGYELHRSRPIMSSTPTFERVGRDPRSSMERDLSRVFAGTFDPRQMLYRWRRLLEMWEIDCASGGPDYRLLISHSWRTGAMGRTGKTISDRESAAEWLQKEEERWIRGQERCANRILARGGRIPVESTEELERAPRPAIGFWLFPIEAMGPMPTPEETVDEFGEGYSWKPKRLLDMRQYWPELCLTYMP
ncbi:hypothetical protein F5B22DRAFT_584156 [Xylaria bambusicola]|uniref:uncharacterized protein n=1 Tax=Xylaria bambusicola TaxID=326684 RepID=UPI0020084FA6|nr:uncharacterized protein F5B22DRAFT_584156 [Xylaria bambusicola]KAI0528202.1 hypothetical protein F5B22DRAFT_584156 [Xylaria bambusicola]